MSLIVQCYGRSEQSTESIVRLPKGASSNLVMDLAIEMSGRREKLADYGSSRQQAKFHLGKWTNSRVPLPARSIGPMELAEI